MLYKMYVCFEQQRPNDNNDDDAMDLDTEDMHHEESNDGGSDNLPPALLPDQVSCGAIVVLHLKQVRHLRVVEA